MNSAMKMLISSIACVCAQSITANAQPVAPVALSRSGSWTISEGRACDLTGTFGNEADRAILILTKHGPFDYIDVTFAPAQMPAMTGTTAVTIDFGPTANPSKVDWAIIRMTNGQSAIQIRGQRLDDYSPIGDKSPPKLTAEMIAVVDWLTIRIGRQDYSLDLRTITRPFAALDQCVDRMVTSWGFDPAVQRTLSKPAEPANYPGDWVTVNDYPTRALRQEDGGTVWFRLNLDSQGRVSDCLVQTASAPPILQTKTCDLLKSRARFSPAIDAQGKPVSSFYLNRVKWTR